MEQQTAKQQATLVETQVGGTSVCSVRLEERLRAEVESLQGQFRGIFNKYLSPDGADTFFISPHVFKRIVAVIPEVFSQLEKRIGQGDTLQGWELENISAILGKALIPDSLSPTLSNARALARDVAEAHSSKERILIRELCCGAGLATAMTWLEVGNVREAGTTIISTDNAIESIATSAIVLSLFDIPHVIVNGAVPDELANFDGVVLQYMDAGEAVRDESARGMKYTVAFSDHGIAYFPQKVNDEIIRLQLDMLEEGGIMYVCGLEPDVTVALEYPFMIREILLGGRKRREAYAGIREERKRAGDTVNEFFDTKEIDGRTAVTRFYTPESAGLYDMLNAFLFSRDERSISTFILYIRSIIDVVKTTKKLGVEVRSPIEHSLHYVEDLMEGRFTAEAIPPLEVGKRVARTLRVQVI